MNIKKVLALILACVLSLSVLASCGGNSNQSNASTPASNDSSDASTSTSAPAGVPAEGTSDETLKVACDGEPTSIFPNYVTNKTSNRVDC